MTDNASDGGTPTHDVNRCHCIQMGRCLVHCATCHCGEPGRHLYDFENGGWRWVGWRLIARYVARLDQAEKRAAEAEARVRELDKVVRGLCGALSVWRPVQPVPDPTDCSSGYPEFIRKAWSEAIDMLPERGRGIGACE